MISPKLAALTALMAVSSMGAVPALAQDVDSSVSQSITQSNEACTNTAVNIADAEAASVVGDADAEAEAEQDVDQSNKCKVTQSNDADQDADVEIETEG